VSYLLVFVVPHSLERMVSAEFLLTRGKVVYHTGQGCQVKLLAMAAWLFSCWLTEVKVVCELHSH
jgi:hypothetical protein